MVGLVVLVSLIGLRWDQNKMSIWNKISISIIFINLAINWLEVNHIEKDILWKGKFLSCPLSVFRVVKMGKYQSQGLKAIWLLFSLLSKWISIYISNKINLLRSLGKIPLGSLSEKFSIFWSLVRKSRLFLSISNQKMICRSVCKNNRKF